MANLKVDLSLNDGNLKQQINADKQAVKDFGKSVGEQASQFAKVAGGITNYKRKLSELSKEVVSLEMSYKSLSDEQRKSDFGQALAKQLDESKKKAAELKDQLLDTQAEIKQLSSDSFKTDALTSGIETVSTSMSAFVAVTELCGGSTERLEDAIKKLIVIQSVSAASVRVINALQAQSALMLGVRKVQEAALTAAITIRTAAETRGTAAVKAATVAQAALNAVAKANPYVLLAGAVAAVAGALFAFSGKSKEAADETKTLTAEMQLQKKLAETYTSTLSNTYSDLMTRYAKLQTQWQSLTSEQQKVEWIKKNKTELDNLNLAVNNVADAEKVFNNNTDAVVQSFVRRARAAARVAQLTELYRKQIELLDKKSETSAAISADAARSGRNAKAGDEIKDATYRNSRYGSVNASGKWVFSESGASLYSGQDTSNAVAVQKIETEIAANAAEIEKVKQAIASETDLVSVSGGNTSRSGGTDKTNSKQTFLAGSLSDLEHQLSDLQSKYKDGLISLTPSDYQQKVKELSDAITQKKIELGLYVPEDKISKQLQSLNEKNAKISRQQTFSSFDVAVGNDKPSGERDLSYIQQQMNYNDSLIKQLQDLQNEYAKLGEKGKDSYDTIGSELDNVKTKQAELSEQAKQYTEENKRIEENAKKWGEVGNMVGQVGSAFSSLGGAFDIPALNVAGIIAQAIASVIQGYSTATAQAGTLGPWAWAAFALSGLAQVVSVISQIHSLSGYAQGGVVSGGSYVGDSQIIRVNSGEAVLTQSDQNRFLRLLDGGTVANSGGTYQAVEFKLRGSDIYGVLRNYSKQQAAIGHNTGIK